MDFLKNLPIPGIGAKPSSTAPVGIPGADPSQPPIDTSGYTIVDLVAPQYVEFDWNTIRVNDKYSTTLVVNEYPRTVRSTWLSPLINFESSLAISTFYYPVDGDMIIEKLRTKIAELEASLSTQYDKGIVLDAKNKVALQDAQGLMDNVASGKEKFFNIGMYIRLNANTKAELEKNIKNLLNTMRAIGLNAVPLTLQMDDAFVATLPYGKDPIYRIRNMDTTAMGMTFPFVTSDLTMNQGILYGVNMHNNSMVIFDRFEMPNYNEIVLAVPGAGKSYMVKLQALRYLMTGVDIIAIDPENEFERLTEAVDGDYIDYKSDGGAKINPLEILKVGDGKLNVVKDKITSLRGFFQIMFDGISASEDPVLDKALQLTYNDKGITNDPSTWQNPPPLLEDLFKVLRGMVEPESRVLASKLEKYVLGSSSGLFNAPTNVDIHNRFTTFAIRDIENDQERALIMQVMLDFIWTRIRTERKKRILIVDEAWNLMQYDQSAKFLQSLSKRGRKYYLGVTVISQQIGDFLKSEYAKAMIENASLKVLLQQEASAIDRIADNFLLSSGEKAFLLNAQKGEGIFFAGRNHVAVRFISSRAENRLITSNPQEIAKMQDAVYDENDLAEGALLYEPGMG